MGFIDDPKLSGLVPNNAVYKISPESATSGEIQDFVTQRISEVNSQLKDISNEFNTILQQLGGLKAPQLPPIEVGDLLAIDTSALSELSQEVQDLSAMIDEHIASLEETVNSTKNSHLNSITNLQNRLDDIANEIGNISMGAIPDAPAKSFSPPSINIPDTPTLSALPEVPEKPVIGTYAFPDTPTITTPVLAELLNITLPSPPNLELPDAPELKTFSIDSVPDVSSWVNYIEEAYSDKFPELVGALKTLIEGGVASEINAINEALIAKKRNLIDDEYKSNIDESQEAFAKLGYSLPSGSVIQMLENAKNKYLRDVSAATKEALEESLKIVQENKRLGVDGGINLERAFIDLFNNKMNRIIESLKLKLDAVSRQFDLSIKRVEAELNAYVQEVQAYKVRLEGELTKLEIYKAELSGEEVKSNINLGLIEVYKAEIQGAESQVKLYQAQIDAVKTMYEAEAQKVEMFKSEVVAYSEQVKSRTLEIESYKSRIDAELAKANIFSSLVNAYASEVQAYSSQVNAITQEASIRAEIMKIKIDALAEIAKIAVEMASMDTQFIQALSSAYGVLGSLGSTVAEATASVAKISTEVSKIQTELDANIKEAQIKAQTATQEVSIKEYEAQIEQYKGLAGVVGGTLSALAGALNVSAQVSEESGVRLSGSVSMNYSDSIQTNIKQD